jgi:tetratricopeptide (TPR) repeat protein
MSSPCKQQVLDVVSFVRSFIEVPSRRRTVQGTFPFARRVPSKERLAYALFGICILALAGCESDGRLLGTWLSDPAFNALTPTVQEPDDVKYYPSDEPLKLGLEHFNRGNYGVSERYLREAVEKAPRDLTAWIALAATYDRIARFDLADRAYRSAIQLSGETTQILNNQGYSYMLRGDLANARRKFLKAYQREPDNPTVANNLKLLNSSERFIQRPPDPREIPPQ